MAAVPAISMIFVFLWRPGVVSQCMCFCWEAGTLSVGVCEQHSPAYCARHLEPSSFNRLAGVTDVGVQLSEEVLINQFQVQATMSQLCSGCDNPALQPVGGWDWLASGLWFCDVSVLVFHFPCLVSSVSCLYLLLKPLCKDVHPTAPFFALLSDVTTLCLCPVMCLVCFFCVMIPVTCLANVTAQFAFSCVVLL